MKIEIYTDGACSGNPGPGGWAWCCGDKSDKGSEKNTTNNRMELIAVVNALKHFDDDSNGIKRIEVRSDSAYVVNAVNKDWLKKWKSHGWKKTEGTDVKNKDLWKDLSNLIYSMKKRNVRVMFIKVKAHKGNVLNERCDKLAKSQIRKG